MAVNLANKYQTKVAERFTIKSLTEAGVNKDYEWNGSNAITVYAIPTVAMNDYTRTGTSRYGTPGELQNTVQTMTLTKDRSFTFAIDRANQEQTGMVMQAGKALRRQTDEVIIPEIDIYRLTVMAAAALANSGVTTLAITAANAYQQFLKMTEYFSDNKVPLTDRIAWVAPEFYSLLKLDSSFLKASDLAVKTLINGQVGEVDGVKIVPVPTAYLPANTMFIGTHPSATVAANQLSEYKTHDNPPGINGWLCEGREIYDAFVLSTKVKAVYQHKKA